MCMPKPYTVFFKQNVNRSKLPFSIEVDTIRPMRRPRRASKALRVSDDKLQATCSIGERVGCERKYMAIDQRLRSVRVKEC